MVGSVVTESKPWRAVVEFAVVKVRGDRGPWLGPTARRIRGQTLERTWTPSGMVTYSRRLGGTAPNFIKLKKVEAWGPVAQGAHAKVRSEGQAASTASFSGVWT